MPEFKVDVLIRLVDQMGGASASAKAHLSDLNSGIKEADANTGMLQQSLSTMAGVMLRDVAQGAFGALTSACNEASDAFQNLELTLTRTAAASGVTGTEAAALQAELGEVAEAQTDLGFSAKDAAGGLEALVKAGMDSADAADALRSALALARLEGVSAEEAAALLVQTLTVFKIEAADSATALDWISKAADSGIGTAKDYAAGLSNAGAAAANMGFSIEETLGALRMLDQTFGSAEESGTFLNMLFKDLIAKGDQLGLSLYNDDHSMRSLNDIVEQLRSNVASYGDNQQAVNEYLAVFDVRAQRAVMGLVNSAESIQDVVGEMTTQNSIQDKLNAAMETTAGRLAELEAREENAAMALGAFTSEITVMWKEFAVALGPVGSLVDALGPTVLQAAFMGAAFAGTQMVSQMIVQYGVMDTLSMATYVLTTSMHGLAIGVAAAAGTFGAVYAILMSMPEESRATAATIAILTGTLIAATVAAAAFYGTLSLGVAVPAILAGVGIAVAGVTVALASAQKTADNTAGSFDNLSGSAKGLGNSLEELALQFQQLTASEEQTYKTSLGNLQRYFTDKYGTTTTESTRIEDVINSHYDKLVDDEQDAFAESIGNHKVYFTDLWGITENGVGTLESFVEDHYSDELRSMQNSYGNQIDETNRFYDNLKAEADAGLNALRSNRNSDLDAAELDMLLQKDAVRSAHDEGLISNETYNNQIAHIEEVYNDKRSEINDSYRLEELRMETKNKEDSEQIALDREAALTKIAQMQAESEVTLMRQKEVDLEAARGMQREAEQAHSTRLKTIYEQRLTDLAEFQAEYERLTREHNAELQRIEAETHVYQGSEVGYWSRSDISTGQNNNGGSNGPAESASYPTVAGWITQSIRDGGAGGAEEVGQLIAYKMQVGGLTYSDVGEVVARVAAMMGWPTSAVRSTMAMVPHFADGVDAVFDTPTLAVFGEAGPERVRIEPLASPTVNGGGGSSGGNIYFSINAPVNIESVGSDEDKRWVEEELRLQREGIVEDVMRRLKK